MTIRAVVRNGRIEPKDPDELPPEGTELDVTPVDSTMDADWDASPEAIEARIAAYMALEPIFDNEEDRAAFAAAIQKQKEWEIAHWDEYVEKIKGLGK